jgi:hypothetical protein
MNKILAGVRRKNVESKRLTPIESAWLVQEFGQLHDEHTLIIKTVNDRPISSETEAVWNKLKTAVLKVDRKVTDLPK